VPRNAVGRIITSEYWPSPPPLSRHSASNRNAPNAQWFYRNCPSHPTCHIFDLELVKVGSYFIWPCPLRQSSYLTLDKWQSPYLTLSRWQSTNLTLAWWEQIATGDHGSGRQSTCLTSSRFRRHFVLAKVTVSGYHGNKQSSFFGKASAPARHQEVVEVYQGRTWSVSVRVWIERDQKLPRRLPWKNSVSEK
jgi:hypothetical protein